MKLILLSSLFKWHKNLIERLLTACYRFRYRQIKWGKSFHVNSRIRFRISQSAIVTIGDNVIFNNIRKNGFSGLNKPCSIFVGNNATLKIGNHSGFSGVSIFCTNHIEIGNYCNIGGDVSIWDTDFHPINYYARRHHNIEKIDSRRTIVEDDVWIGAHSIILKGSIIGARSIIAAGSVVSGKIPHDQVWGGNPIRFLYSLKSINVVDS